MNKNYLILLILLMLLPGCFNRWSCTPRFMNRVRPCGHVGTSAYCTPEPQSDTNVVYQENDITYPNDITDDISATKAYHAEAPKVHPDQALSTETDLLSDTSKSVPLEDETTDEIFSDEFQEEFIEEPELTQEEVIKKADEKLEEEAENDIFDDIERANALDEEMGAKNYEPSEDFTSKVEDDTVSIKADDEITETAQANELDPILFDFDKKKITDKQEQALSKNLEKIKKMAEDGYKIVIAGHACHSAGKEWYNEKISRERAEAVASYLKTKGVKGDNIIIEAHGSKKPIIKEGNSRKQAPNRRVEIHV